MRVYPPSWHGTAAAFLSATPQDLAGPDQNGHWPALLPLLQAALPPAARAQGWTLALNFRLLRLRRRIDVVIATGRAVLALTIRPEARGFLAADRLLAEDAALDLADFHAGCRALSVIPILLVPNGARARVQHPLPFPGASPVIETTRLLLPFLLADLARFPVPHTKAGDFATAPYQPVPSLIEAACLFYARHDVTALSLASAGRGGLARTAAAVQAALHRAQATQTRLVVFVTGQPGAGKTLCGLNLAFTPGQPSAFLTGNPTLVHVLREALVRDAVQRGGDRRAALQRMAGVIQPLHSFRDHHLAHPGPPPERLLIIDEAQRCWSGAHAISKTRNRPVRLADSEPGHLLDIMARRPGWAVLVCLAGSGQEIHDGEGGLAAWGAALARRPDWDVVAAPAATQPGPDPRRHLPALPSLNLDPALDLHAPVRAIHAPDSAAWADAVLHNEPARAASLARHGAATFSLTRSLATLRQALHPRGSRTCGLVASSGARRLRAEGLGAVLPHQDEDAVARWFLDRWPDCRSSDAMETLGTEFAVQGLELDHVGLCWDADLIRTPDGATWDARRFRANAWTRTGAEARANRLNAYRVLLTRARHGTTIWVPQGDPRDPTRNPRLYDAIATYLLGCGATMLDAAAPRPAVPSGVKEATLL